MIVIKGPSPWNQLDILSRLDLRAVIYDQIPMSFRYGLHLGLILVYFIKRATFRFIKIALNHKCNFFTHGYSRDIQKRNPYFGFAKMYCR